ncbi:hypothetical protein [Shewanella algae]|uniref:hypothetical protein n=1 Tax=Shewanella algae TaxID=38313 RepID=UPI001F322EA0|nr:hypothetical protein [Shewanella algae]MCE9781703.1 hypothetical protein [Shewanella algae]MCE9827304.1 hypothetical protein [Shewanella algae]
MRTSFWRFAYDEDQLHGLLETSTLEFPDLSRWPLAKNNTKEKIISDLREGHFILLANFNLTNKIGTVKGVGKIICIEDGVVEVEWKRPIPSWTLTPNEQGGVQQWKNEGVFCFDVNPTKRYKLPALTSKLFASHNK